MALSPKAARVAFPVLVAGSFLAWGHDIERADPVSAFYHAVGSVQSKRSASPPASPAEP